MAIEDMQSNFRVYWGFLKSCEDDKERVGVLSLLPFIGPVTKYHLARNLGLDVAKPDRHLTRLSEHFGFPDVQSMCASS